MKSFSLIRTNTGLTTNVKTIITSTYSLFLESINSTPELNDTQYKKFQFNSADLYDETLPLLWGNGKLQSNIAFSVSYDNDNDTMSNDFSNQIDDLYFAGCRVNSDEKNYTEDFEYFAPLYIFTENIPTNFIIFRVDGPGIINLSPSNFYSEIISNLKCVKLFDLTTQSPLGQWIKANYTDNNQFPYSPFEIDYRNLQFSYWNGIDYIEGGYTKKGIMMNTTLEYENTFFDMETNIYNGYQSNNLIFPNIQNFSFMFNDTPSSPITIATWSINRYLGFYLDNFEYQESISPYKPPQLKSDVIILEGNILQSQSSSYPFIDTYIFATASTYVEIDGIFYIVQQISENTQILGIQKTKIASNVYEDQVSDIFYNFYTIISDINFTGSQSQLNQNIISINTTTQSFVSEIYKADGITPWQLENWSTADVWVTNINGIYHNITSDGLGNFFINSDYAFSTSNSNFNYWISAPDPNYLTTISLMASTASTPVAFPIYRCKFTDIKDFDYKIIETDYAHYEYESTSQLNLSDESKIYLTDISSSNNPPSLDDFSINGQVINIPTSSEYTANYETFQITNDNLTPLWRKNPIRCKWGYQNSISSYDYPYLLNNSKVSEDYNRSVNTFTPQPSRVERNLDYFYSINSSTSSYSFQSLHVNGYMPNGDLDPNFYFDMTQYLGITISSSGTISLTQSSDYFTWFFGKNTQYDSGQEIVNTNKWSYFNYSDSQIIPNNTLFRGLKFNLYEVQDVIMQNGTIQNINITPTNIYDDYKFSILLSSGTWSITSINSASQSYGIPTSSINTLSWEIIENWAFDKTYYSSGVVLVLYYDVLYQCVATSSISNPNDNPSVDSAWTYSLSSLSYTKIPFYRPDQESYPSYNDGSWVYNGGEYYIYESLNTNTFWNPGLSYSQGSIVLYKNSIWISTTSSNVVPPDSTQIWRDSYSNIYNFWSISTTASVTWEMVNLWSATQSYTASNYAVFNNTLYQSISTNQNLEPDLNLTYWNYIYSMIPNNTFNYQTTSNSVISLNNRYYIVLTNTSNSTLQNGIVVYINNIWKNVLIDISINDNTLPNISNIERDNLYGDLYSVLTAFNFMNSINDLTNTYGFADNLTYVIINENQTFNIYNFNSLVGLPCLLTCQGPDTFSSRVLSLSTKINTLTDNNFKSVTKLPNGEINDLKQLNYYNGNPLGAEIERVPGDPMFIDNYHGLQNNIYNTLYRHSGFYMPIFTTVELFDHSDSSVMDSGANYHFDTTLTNFGLIKEIVITKVNTSGNVLQLQNKPNVKSMWPMIDEFGYTYTDFFIFKSNWDLSYYIQCNKTLQSSLLAFQSSISISPTNLTNNNTSF